MSSSARVLRFPSRRRASLIGSAEAEQQARDYLAVSREERSDSDPRLREPEFLTAVCGILRREANTSPRMVADEAAAIYRLLASGHAKCGVFDEHEFFLGDTALVAASACRLLGEREETECWLDRAEAGYRHTINPGPGLAQIAFVRLALRYDKRQYREVAELSQSAIRSFEGLGLRSEYRKGRFLRAMALKQLARHEEAWAEFSALAASPDREADLGLLGQVLIETGAYAYAAGQKEKAAADLGRAVRLLEQSGRTIAVAHVHVTLAELLRDDGRLDEAVESYRRGSASYVAIEMATQAAYVRILTAETLLAADRPREAEWEILQALPTVEEQKMVEDGVAAVALLRESVKRRKTDPNALRELREHLQKQN